MISYGLLKIIVNNLSLENAETLNYMLNAIYKLLVKFSDTITSDGTSNLMIHELHSYNIGMYLQNLLACKNKSIE